MPPRVITLHMIGAANVPVPPAGAVSLFLNTDGHLCVKTDIGVVGHIHTDLLAPDFPLSLGVVPSEPAEEQRELADILENPDF